MIISDPVEIKRLLKEAHADGYRRELSMAKQANDAGWTLTPEQKKILAQADIAAKPSEAS